MKKFETGILIGQTRLEEMQRIGIKVHYEILSDEKYSFALKNKLLEECNELIDCNNKVEAASEIADVLDIIECIKNNFNIDDNLINYYRSENLKSKGSFDSKILSKYLEISEDNPAIDYYLSRPEKYPEIK